MANIPSSFIRPQHQPGTRNQPDTLVTSVTERRPPRSERALRLITLPREPEDARITGGTRSLDRRLLALNFSGTHPGTNAA